MAGRLAGKVAIVTGAARGIGFAGATMFAKEGASVVVADKDAAGAEAASEKVRAAGGKSIAVHVDITKPEMVQAMVKKAIATYGKLDILYNNAGYSIVEKVGAADLPLDVWHETIDVNVNGTFYCCKYALPHLIANGGGVILNTASVAIEGAMEYNAYAVGKGALVPLTLTLAMQYIQQKVRVNLIVPGGTRTARIVDRFSREGRTEGYGQRAPLGMNDPEDLAYAAVFLASDEARHITGQVLHVDGGYHVHWYPGLATKK
jgi:NAD(P)-dependent dehydrogenase (short-subunit alcohol dehydrogenase family)